MRYKKYSLIAVSVAMIVALSGCGMLGSNNGSSEASSDTSSSVVSSSAESSSSQSGSSSSSDSTEESSSESSTSSESQSDSESDSSESSSQSSAQTVGWNGNFSSEMGSAAQITLTISNATDKEFKFDFFAKGISYSGTASIDANSPNIATYQDPSADYSLTFSLSSDSIEVAEKGSFPDANTSLTGNFVAMS